MNNLQQLEKKDALRILDKLEFFVCSPNPLLFATALKNSRIGEFRFRVGNFRIVFDVDSTSETIKNIMILAVKHRREVYDIF